MYQARRGGFGNMVTKLIIDNLRAMGANPETVVNSTGEKVIKVNAPIIGGKGSQK